jgi:hypothetical protein
VEDSLAIGLDGSPGIRDAEEILIRVRQDEREAFEARERYRTDGLPTLDPDDQVADHISPGETVVAVRKSTVLSRPLRGEGTEETAGTLYLTNQRLLVLGHSRVAIELGQIDELAIAGERLLVTLIDGTGVSIDADRPRLLRVQIAAALTAGR